jgi:hypothetical protein
VDVAAILAGTWEPEVATLMVREDGQGLLYPGRVHSFHGESESGKSLVVQALAAEVINSGGSVLFLDFESDPLSVVNRVLAFGADRDGMAERFTYVRPQDSPAGDRHWHGLLTIPWTLVLVDGVTDAMSVLDLNEGDPNVGATLFMRLFCKTLADDTGAAVVVIDHVVKSNDGRGRFAIGGQAKMAGLTGAAYMVETGEDPPRLGGVGTVVLRIAKDRPGTIRPACGQDYRASDRTQVAARVRIDSTTAGASEFQILGPGPFDGQAPGGQERAGAALLLQAEISRLLEGLAPGTSLPQIRVVEAVGRRKAEVVRALVALTDGGYVVREGPGPRGAWLYRSVRPYRSPDPLAGFDPDNDDDNDEDGQASGS